MKRLASISLLLLLMAFGMSGCMQAPPDHIENICSIFNQYPDWYWQAGEVQDKWGVPIPTLMAIIYQESHFRADAKPPRQKLLWIIPWKRPTSATGYSQAITATWEHYKRDTAKTYASRNGFDDATDFIGWYVDFIHKKLGIPKYDTYNIYLAYHEGTGNYAKGSYRRQPWLMQVSRHVAERAWIYKTQLARCESSLPRKSWWRS
jgi:hypothetical protein